MNFSFLGGLANLLPGYIQGQRMANQDNWQDLMNYNQVQQGQLGNAFTEATFQPRLDTFRDYAVKSNLDMNGALMDFRTKWLYQPYQEMQAQAYSTYAPWLAPTGPQSQWQAYQMTMQNPNLAAAILGGGKTPSALMRF